MRDGRAETSGRTETDADRIAQCPAKDAATPIHEDMCAILADCLATARAELDAERAATVEERAARVAAESELEKERAETLRLMTDLRRRMVDAERNEHDMGERMIAALHERDALAGNVDAGRAELMRLASERAAKVAEVTAERDQERRAVDDLMSDLREMEARAVETTAVLSAVTVERDGLRDRLAQTVAERDEKIRAAEERALRAERDLDVEEGLSAMRLERADRHAADLADARRQLEVVRAELAESTAAARGLAKEGLDVRADRQRLAADGERLAGLIERYAVATCVCGARYTVAEYAALPIRHEAANHEERLCLCGRQTLTSTLRKVTP